MFNLLLLNQNAAVAAGAERIVFEEANAVACISAVKECVKVQLFVGRKRNTVAQFVAADRDSAIQMLERRFIDARIAAHSGRRRRTHKRASDRSTYLRSMY